MTYAEGSMPFLIGDALRGYSEDFRWLDTSAKPYRFMLNGQTYSIHASDAHHAKRANPDEWRIQVPAVVRDELAKRQGNGDKILFVGFFEDEQTFTGWEAAYVLSLTFKDVGSIYVPHSDSATASISLVALDVATAKNLERGDTSKITLRKEFLGFYAENATILHESRNADELTTTVAAFADFVEQPSGSGEQQSEVDLGGDRQKVVATRTAYPRDPKFRDAVMKVYLNACCICDRQLGLIEAAHIIPHAHPDCTQAVRNGLALCIEHHRLYDDGLLLPRAGGALQLNEARVEHLKNIGQDRGLEAVRALAAQGYRVPEDEQSRPDDELLERGVRIRLGTDT